MKSKNLFSCIALTVSPLFGTIVLYSACLIGAQAGNTWDGGGSDDNWSTAENWNPSGAPLPSDTTDLVFSGVTRLFSTYDYNDGDRFRNITFDATADAFYIDPDVTDSGIDWYGGITNQSAYPQTLSINLYLQAATNSLNALTENLVCEGALYNNSNSLKITGSATTSVEIAYGKIFSGSGNVELESGTLKLGGATFAGTARSYAIAAGAVLHINGNTGVASGTTTLSGAGTLRVSGGTFGNEGPNTPVGSGRNIAMNLGSGGRIDIQSGATMVNGGWQNTDWTNNKASIKVDGTFDIWDGKLVIVNSLDGAGLITKRWGNSNLDVQVGVDNGSGDFTGTLYAGSNGGWTLVKKGTGTQKLSGTADYISVRSRVEGGVLMLNMVSSATVHAIGSGLTLDGGIARLAGSGGDQIYNETSVTINTGAFDMDGQSETVAFVEGAAGSIINDNATQSVLSFNTGNRGTRVYSGSINGNIRVAVTNSATKNSHVQTLNGTNGYTGGTLIDNGHLRATSDAALGAVPGAFDATNITLQNGGVLQNNNTNLTLDAKRGIYLGVGGGVIYSGWVNEGRSITINGAISGPGSLTKIDGAALTLAGVNTYSGSTYVKEGILIAKSATFDDTAAIDISVGGFLQLDHTVTDVVGSLILNGVVQSNGIYDSTNSQGRITGTGKLWVGPVPSSGFAAWAVFSGIPGAAANDDYDNDGIANIVEYALGLDPKSTNTSPGSFDGTTLTFTKGAAAIAGHDIHYIIETSPDLGASGPWAAVVTQTAPDASTIISYSLPKNGPRLFARLKVVQIP